MVKFEDKDKARAFFQDLRQKFINWNSKDSDRWIISKV